MYFSLVLVVIFGIVLYKYLSRHNKYWEQRNIPYKRVFPILGEKVFFGLTSIHELLVTDYNKFYNEPFFGTTFFNQPTLIVKDPNLIRDITIKDFDHFLDHSFLFIKEKLDPIFSKSLFFRKGQQWKDMRSILSPLFTGRKMRIMFDLVVESSQDLLDFQIKEAQSGKSLVYEMKQLFCRLTADVIASCAFGIKCNSFENPNNEFHQMELKALQVSPFRMAAVMFFSKICEVFNYGFFPKDTINYFYVFMKDTMKIREDKQIYRPDMLQLMMQVRKGEVLHSKNDDNCEIDDEVEFSTAKDTTIYLKKESIKKEFSDEEILAQILIFLIAGFDGPSKVLSFGAHELAVHPDIQKRLQDEIDNVLQNNEKLTYDLLRSMKYLDMVVSEILRKYPIGAFIERRCLKKKEYFVQANNKTITIDNGMTVLVPVFGLHYDLKYYPNPNKFDPERFTDENKKLIADYTYLPFGSGPRNCIGSRFALMEIKIALFFLLSKFNICVCSKTQIPLRFAKVPTEITSENGFWLELKLRQND